MKNKTTHCPLCGRETDEFDPEFGCSECAEIMEYDE